MQPLLDQTPERDGNQSLILNLGSIQWLSEGDKRVFSQWLSSISGFRAFSIENGVIFATFAASEVDRAAIQDIVGLFRRYKVADFQQLRRLELSSEGEWFSDPEKYWHDLIYTTQTGRS